MIYSGDICEMQSVTVSQDFTVTAANTFNFNINLNFIPDAMSVKQISAFNSSGAATNQVFLVVSTLTDNRSLFSFCDNTNFALALDNKFPIYSNVNGTHTFTIINPNAAYSGGKIVTPYTGQLAFTLEFYRYVKRDI